MTKPRREKDIQKAAYNAVEDVKTSSLKVDNRPMSKRIISNADFCHLHCHTEFSSFDGLNKIGSDDKDGKVTRYGFPMLARKQGFKALAMTDHGNIGGALKFMTECTRPAKDENGNELPAIKPIIGCEFYLSKNRTAHSKEEQPDGRKGNRHILLLAKNWTGYQNLCRLSQESWDNVYHKDPRIDVDLLNKYHDGLILSSACLSSVINANLLRDRYDQAKKSVQIFKDIFKEDMLLEAMYHGMDAEAMIIPDILKLGKEMNVPVICTNDVHYSCKDAGPSHQLLMAMSTSKCMTDPKRLSFPYQEFYLKSASEMAQHFGSHPELLLNTMAVADKIDPQNILTNLKSGMRLPRYPIPEGFTSPHDYLEHLAMKGLSDLGLQGSEKHTKRLRMELDDIRIAWENNKYDFATYLLIVQDYVQEAERRGILTGPGRGSGYGSVLLRVLGITYGPDPLEYGLLWERFLGFDDRYFVDAADFGIDEQSLYDLTTDADDAFDVEEMMGEERDVEDDLGGVDRY